MAVEVRKLNFALVDARPDWAGLAGFQVDVFRRKHCCHSLCRPQGTACDVMHEAW
jgi:hypothetical protein